MKKLIVVLSLIAAVSAYSQGTVSFQNRNANTTPPIDAPISFDASGPVAAGRINGSIALAADANGFVWGGTNAQAGLYGAAAGTAQENYVLLVPSVGFRLTTATAGYVNVGSASSRTVAGVAPGALADFQIRAWDCGISGVLSYEDAVAISNTRKVYLGMSPVLPNIALGGVGVPPTPAANLLGLQSFSLAYVGVPEPSVIGLGILGALAGLMVFRRRN
jgi:hypothetical protein